MELPGSAPQKAPATGHPRCRHHGDSRCSRPNLEQANRSEGWSSAWFGDTPREKALGVLVKPPWTIREMRALKPKWAGRVVIDGPSSIELFPVWAHRDTTSGLEYIEQVHFLLDIIDHTSLSQFTIVAGDFNSNSIWDRDYGLKSHTAAVSRFHKLGLESAYYIFFAESQGAEKRPTHWNNKNEGLVPHRLCIPEPPAVIQTEKRRSWFSSSMAFFQ